MHELAESYDRAHNIQLAQKNETALSRQKYLLRQWIEENAHWPYIPTVSAALVKGNRVEFFYRHRTDPGQRYSVASFTKTFTAIAALQLVDRGIISLDEPVNNYIPLFLENPELDTRLITLRDLMTHTAGVVNYVGGEEPYLPKQRYPAGSRFYYSNQGFNVVGMIVEKISGKKLGTYITEHILIPLEMKDSIAPDSMKASGGMQCSVEDLTRYVMMLIHRGTYRGRIIVSEDVFNEIFRETIPSPRAKYKEYRGISWRIWSIDDRPYSMNHAALWNGSGGWIQIFPTLGTGYVFMSDPPLYDIDGFYRFYRGLKGEFLKITAIASQRDLPPTAFHASVPKTVRLWDYTGLYKNSIDGRTIRISMSSRGHLVAKKEHTGAEYDIHPTSLLTFVYIYPEQTEKGLAFDFTWRDGKIVGLGVVEGYYEKIADRLEGEFISEHPEGL